MSSIPILSAQLDWPSTIGGFLLKWGTLEYLVFVFLKDHSSADEFDKVKKLHFKDRVDRITQLLIDARYPADQQTEFTRLVDRLEPIRELRNHIAHGHLYLRLDADTKSFTITLLKAMDVDTGFLPDSEHVEFAQLQAALPTLDEMIGAFGRLAGFQTPVPLLP
jgi:hypothetical protein